MSAFLLHLIPTAIKALIGVKDKNNKPILIDDALGVSIKLGDNKKALTTAIIALLLTYDIKISNEWLALLTALLPYILAVWAGLFAVSEAPKAKQ